MQADQKAGFSPVIVESTYLHARSRRSSIVLQTDQGCRRLSTLAGWGLEDIGFIPIF